MEQFTFNDVWEWLCMENEIVTKPIIRQWMTQYPQFAAELWDWWKGNQIDDLNEALKLHSMRQEG